MEVGSQHPLASAIVSAAESHGLHPAKASDFQCVIGNGVVRRVEGRLVVLGNLALLDEQ